MNMIAGYQIGDQSSTWVTENTGSIWYINAMRKSLEHGADYLRSSSAETFFHAMDDTYSASDLTATLASPGAAFGTNIQPFQGTVGSNVVLGATTSTSIANPLYNKAFANALQSFSAQFTLNSATNAFVGQVNIPLKDLIPAIDAMDFPVRNFYLKLILFLANPLQFQPFVVCNDVAPTITIGNNGTGSPVACNLFYRALHVSPDMEKKLQARMTAGFNRVISFHMTDWYGPGLFNNNATSLQLVSSTSIVAPQRTWLIGAPKGSSVSSTQYSAIMGAETGVTDDLLTKRWYSL